MWASAPVLEPEARVHTLHRIRVHRIPCIEFRSKCVGPPHFHTMHGAV